MKPLFVSFAVSTLVFAPLRAEHTAQTYFSDNACGPRCVQYLVSHLQGRAEPLIPLIRELQGDPMGDYCSMKAIAEALERRGIRTLPIQLAAGSPLVAPAPAVLHVRQRNGSGHFLVWLGQHQPGFEDVWDGVHGYRSLSSEQLWLAFSGKALITSDVMLGANIFATNESWLSLKSGLFLLAIVICLIGLARGMWRSPFTRRQQPQTHPLTGAQGQ